MKQLKDVTLNLKGVSDDTIHSLFDLAQAHNVDFDIWVTDGGYDLVAEDSNEEMDTNPIATLLTQEQADMFVRVAKNFDAATAAFKTKNDPVGNFPFKTNGVAPFVKGSFADELRVLINKHSLEGESDTPDYILTEYLLNALTAFTQATNARRRHFTA